MKLQLRIGGHETFYPRERWLYKGITEKEFRSKLQFFGEEENDYPTDLLGVGVNMVKSIRYWILACGLVVREGSHDRMSDWGKEILKYDPYLDQPISYWIIHYRLVTNDQGPTSWKWFFSESDTNQFDKNRWVGECKNWMEKEFRRDVSERSIANDYQTMMGMYSWGEKKDHFYPSPFLNMNLIRYDQHLKKYFRNTEVAIPPIVLTYLLWLFINTYYHETGSVDLDMIRRIPDSPLRIYRIETDQVFAMMDELPTSISKKIRISRTAGMKTIQMTDLKGSEILKEIYKLRMNLSLSKSG